jgi:hypothetical protein
MKENIMIVKKNKRQCKEAQGQFLPAEYHFPVSTSSCLPWALHNWQEEMMEDYYYDSDGVLIKVYGGGRPGGQRLRCICGKKTENLNPRCANQSWFCSKECMDRYIKEAGK